MCTYDSLLPKRLERKLIKSSGVSGFGVVAREIAIAAERRSRKVAALVAFVVRLKSFGIKDPAGYASEGASVCGVVQDGS